jgi:uncharacterized protein (TIGR02246 family)
LPASKPEEINQLLGIALSKGDLEGAMALYEPDATFVPQPGQVVAGAAIKEAINAFIALKPTLQIEVTSVTQAGDLALMTSKWTLDGSAPDGSALKMSGRGAEVVRRHADGSWRYVIDNPYGGAEG